MGVAEGKKWPGTAAETKFAEYLVSTAGGHFVTVVRRGVGEMLGVRVPGQTFVVQELMATASSEIDRLQRENAELRQRLDIGPFGEDAIDVAESAAGHLRHRAEAAEAEVKQLREALQNMMGIYDTPLSRRRMQPDAFMTEALNTARTALDSTGGEHYAD